MRHADLVEMCTIHEVHAFFETLLMLRRLSHAKWPETRADSLLTLMSSAQQGPALQKVAWLALEHLCVSAQHGSICESSRPPSSRFTSIYLIHTVVHDPSDLLFPSRLSPTPLPIDWRRQFTFLSDIDFRDADISWRLFSGRDKIRA